jgi:hypothetical protein
MDGSMSEREPSARNYSQWALLSEIQTVPGAPPAVHVSKNAETHVSPHDFKPRGLRVWICDHCYAPRKLHPRTTWTRARPLGENYYLSANAPHFKEGW